MKPALLLSLACATLVLPACDWMPGYPDPANRWSPESAVTDFTTLYRENCLACHSDGMTTSASIPMNFPRYIHLVPVEKLHEVIANGVPGTPMPGFAESTGGPLNEDQINALVAGILAWETGSAREDNLPSYSAPLGDVVAGQTAFKTHCATCHQPGDTLLDPSYLGLVSDQYLRTVTIVGRPKLGMEPTNLTDPDVADIVAWMASHRHPVIPEGSQPQERGIDSANAEDDLPTIQSAQPTPDPQAIAAPPAE